MTYIMIKMILDNIVLKNDNKQEIKNIYHISDIHIRNEHRHEEYLLVFERLYEYLSNEIINNSDSIIILTGDILHFKIQLSPEAISITSNFFKKLSLIMPVILIPGNHDCNLANLKRLDALTPIVEDINNLKNFYYLKTSGVYQYQNIFFGFTSVFENVLIKASSIKINNITYKNIYKIALYHGAVHNAQTDVGARMNLTQLTADHFNGYDYVLLGDIHKYQYMNDAKTIAYSGSLIQQSYGEKVENHGVLKWNLNLHESEFIPIKNDYGYHTITIIDGKMPDLKLTHNPRIRFNLVNTGHVEYENCLKQLQSMYNIQEIITDYITSDVNSNNIKTKANDYDQNTLTDITNQKIMIKKYLTSHNVTSKTMIDNLIKLHEKIYQKEHINLALNQIQRWKILELKFSNMLSYGKDNFIDFRSYQINNIIGIMAPNRYGKSAILDIILFCLFDKFSRGDRRDILNKNCNNMFCSLSFSIGNQLYLIERIGLRNKKSVKIDVNFYNTINDNTKKCLNGIDKNDTNRKIVELIGSYNDYVATCFALQGKDNSFLDMTQLQRKDYLNEILKLNLFEDCYKNARNKLKELTGQLKLLTKNHDSHKFDVEKKSYKEHLKQYYNLKNQLKRISNLSLLIDSNLTKPIMSQYIELSEFESDLKSVEKIDQKISYLRNALITLNKNNSFNTKQLDEEYLIISEKILNMHSDKGLIDLREQIENQFKNLISIPKININELLKEKQVIINQINNYDYEFDSKLNLNLDLEQIENQIKLLESKILLVPSNIVNDYENMKNKLNQLELQIMTLFDDSKLTQYDEKQINKIKLLIKCKKSFVKKLTHIDKIMKLMKFDCNCDCNGNECQNNLLIYNQLQELIISYQKSINDKNKKWLNKISVKNENTNENSHTLLTNLIKTYHDLTERFNSAQEEMLKYSLNQKYILAIESKKKLKELVVLNKRLEIIDTQISTIKHDQMKNDNTNNNILQLKLKLKTHEDTLNNLMSRQIEIKNKLKQYDVNLIQSQKIKIIKQIRLLKLYRMEFIKYKSDQKFYDHYHKISESLNLSKTEIQNKMIRLKTQIQIDLNNIKIMEKNELQLLQTKDKIQLYQMYIKLTNHNGLPYEILKTYIPKIQTQINQILSSIVDFSIEFQLEDGKIQINILYPKMKDYNVCLTSGFEKFITSIALRMTLSRISLIAKPNFIVIDEGWSCFDSENLSNVSNVLNYLKTQYDYVIIISHLDEMKIQADYVVTINKKNGFSHVNPYKNDIIIGSNLKSTFVRKSNKNKNVDQK